MMIAMMLTMMMVISMILPLQLRKRMTWVILMMTAL